MSKNLTIELNGLREDRMGIGELYEFEKTGRFENEPRVSKSNFSDGVINPDGKIDYIVELEEGVWIAPWDGDPGRTLKKEFADIFHTKIDAEEALRVAREYRPFENATLQPVHG